MDVRRLIRAAQVVDAAGRGGRPGALLLEGDEVIAAGTPQTIGEVPDAVVTELAESCVIPALVNAHTHLDLTHLAPRPFDGDFARWLDGVRSGRAVTPAAIAESVRRGIALVRAGGTAAVGDIAGSVGGAASLAPMNELARSALVGVSYLEFFGQGCRERAAVEAIEEVATTVSPEVGGIRPGLQPHAPYTCGPEVYRAAARYGLPVATHLAESAEEIEFSRTATGPIASILRALGAVDDTVRGSGKHPVDALADALAAARFLCAHANYVEPAHLPKLARWGATVVYCPRASRYFGHPAPGQAPHRYRAMIDAGVNVALGTDGFLCLDTPDRISVLDEMRLLHRRDGTDPALLLRMATVAGAAGLELDPALFCFDEGPVAGVIAVPCRHGATDPLRDALLRDDPPIWVSHDEPSVHRV